MAEHQDDALSEFLAFMQPLGPGGWLKPAGTPQERAEAPPLVTGRRAAANVFAGGSVIGNAADVAEPPKLFLPPAA